jgi:hypothetical protein
MFLESKQLKSRALETQSVPEHLHVQVMELLEPPNEVPAPRSLQNCGW